VLSTKLFFFLGLAPNPTLAARQGSQLCWFPCL